jgi:hypothetical protein
MSQALLKKELKPCQGQLRDVLVCWGLRTRLDPLVRGVSFKISIMFLSTARGFGEMATKKF